MKRYRFLSLVLAGALVLTSFPSNPVFAATQDEILPDETLLEDTLPEDTLTEDTLPENTLFEDDRVLLSDDEDTLLADDIGGAVEDPGIPDDEYHGYVEPEWAGEPAAVDEDLTVGDIDEMVEGDETVYDENGIAIETDKANGFTSDTASIEPISDDTAALPAAYPSAYGTGSASELEIIDEALSDRITPERSQSPYGTCWAHETIALTEAYKINRQGGDPTSVDNSERHLVYNTYYAGTNPLFEDTRDAAVLNDTDETTYLGQGGNVLNASMTLNKWRGVAVEEEAPYRTIGDGTWTNTEFLSTGGRLENCYMINIKENPEMVKRFIREYGAVGISYNSESGTSAATNSKYYNSQTNAYYCDEAKNTNHGVAIVGWDDNFPASSFVKDPGSDGAWLIRNSWKVGGKVKDKYYGSYFWLSYQDKTLADRAYALKMQDSAGFSDNNYFYDTQVHGAEIVYAEGYEVEAANIFKVCGGADYERLDSVTIESFVERSKNPVADTDYNVKIYANLTDQTKPDSGTLVAEKEGDLPFLGLYTVRFDSPVILQKDTVFSVVVSINGGGRSVDIESNLSPQDGGEQYVCGALEGQSFYRYKQGNKKTSWTDNTTTTENRTREYGNFCIGAQTSDFDGNACSVVVYSRTDESADPVADLLISGTTPAKGSEVIATAPDKSGSGYTFLGWFEATEVKDGKVTSYGTKPLCEKLKYVFTAVSDIKLAAVYTSSAAAVLTVDVRNGASYRVGTNTYDKRGRLPSKVGKKHTIYAADPDMVLRWLNEDGKVIGRGSSVTITLTRNTTITLEYRDEERGEAYLQFVSDYGQVLSCRKVSDETSAFDKPQAPTRYGYTFAGWKFEGTDTEVTDAGIRTRIGTGGMITCVPKYTKKEDKYSVTVNYLCGGKTIKAASVFADRPVGEEFTAGAPSISGYTFECWKDSDGNEIAYDPEYCMMIKGDVTLTASYLAGGSKVNVKPVITLGNPYKSGERSVLKVAAAATRSVPEGYELIEHGMLYARNITDLDGTSFVYGTQGVGRYVASDPDKNGVLYLNVGVSSEQIPVSFRGYMVLKDRSTGKIDTYYTGIKTGRYNIL